MGCDIHAYTEYRENGLWISNQVWSDPYNEGSLDVDWETRFTDRNYELFGLLASVRRDTGHNIAPRGLPLNMSPQIKQAAESWGVDGHSHSFFELGELLALKESLADATTTIEGMKDEEEVEALKNSLASDNPDYSLLYPYCGFSNTSGYVHFEVDVPVLWKVGLDKFIDYVKEAGDESRVVFWFDN